MMESEKSRRVLIVDDERVITDTLVVIFGQSGYEAKGAYSTEEALSLMEEWHPELAIIDVMLPAMNGIDLAIRVRAEWPECHISLFSGQAATSDLLSDAINKGHQFDILAKPVHPSELLGMVGRLLGEPPISIGKEN
jgi:DNA-binding response OmpR family regulator